MTRRNRSKGEQVRSLLHNNNVASHFHEIKLSWESFSMYFYVIDKKKRMKERNR